MCVFASHCLLNPTPAVSSRCSWHINLISRFLIQWAGHAYMCKDCVRFLPEATSTLCSTRDAVYVGVCLFVTVFACSPQPPLCPPDVHSPVVKLVGGPRLHASRLRPILDRGSNHPLCVCVCHCLFPNLPLRPPTVHSPKSLFVGRATPTFVYIASNPLSRLHPPYVTQGTQCECVCVCLPLPASPTPHCFLPMLIAH